MTSINNSRLKVLAIFSLLSLAACNSAPLRETLEAPTETLATTATPIPFGDLNLEPLLILSGDLPAGLTGAQVRNFVPEMFEGVPNPDYEIFQQFSDGDGAAGGVAVLVYENLESVSIAYDFILGGFGVDNFEITGLGEKAVGSILELELPGLGTIKNTDMVYLHCHSVVHVRFSGSANIDYVTAYGLRLASRLESIVCRN